MNAKFQRCSSAICILVFAASPSLGDETSDTIKKADALYNQGRLGKAYTELENAAASIARQLEGRFAKTFPAPPKGWAARPARSPVSGKRKLGYGIRLHRNYSKTESRGVVKTQLIVDDQSLIVRMARYRSNPKSLARQNYRRISAPGGGDAFIRFHKGRKVGDAFVLIADRIYISIFAQRVDDPAIMTTLLSQWDYARLKKLADLK